MKRITSIDFTRGLVMIIMALDHVRDFIHVDAVSQSPTNLSTTTPILFFTRWITYLCAPTFVFLAGTSAYITFNRENNMAQSRKFLLKRGLWLVLLEFTLVNFGLYFDPGFHNFLFEVIAAIGFGFIMLSLLIKFPVKSIAIIGLLIICCHNLLPLIPFSEGSVVKAILMPFFGVVGFPLSSQTTFVVAYPPVPWLGIMLVGFASGKLFELPGAKRKMLFVKIGSGALLLFAVVRFVNIYGDPSLWSAQKDGVYTFLSFMNVTKYPPSLLFCLVTLGIMFLILAFAEQMQNNAAKILTVYGRVPLFYFLVHFYLIHLIMVAVMFIQGFHFADMDFASGGFGRPKAVASGLQLWAVYLIWVGVVVVLYKPCAWFGKYKAAHKENAWLKYL
ncbi:MAG TPA: heparan-alpha-glucosaminide N-acetyltransferase domain-containing protein [Panacibacter sp.]|nr:heparan-alpha-glucosaminide N-acetyltransferase domain-containing protein [Panacibacter sp.]